MRGLGRRSGVLYGEVDPGGGVTYPPGSRASRPALGTPSPRGKLILLGHAPEPTPAPDPYISRGVPAPGASG